MLGAHKGRPDGLILIPARGILEPDDRRGALVAEVDVCPLTALPPGSVTAADIDGARVCVANVHGELFAVQDSCPHLFANLSAGELNGANIVCPWHGSEFDMRTGATKRWLPSGIWNILNRTTPPLPTSLEAKLKPSRIRSFRARVVDGVVRVSDE